MKLADETARVIRMPSTGREEMCPTTVDPAHRSVRARQPLDDAAFEYLRRQECNRQLWEQRARTFTGNAVTCRTDWIVAASLRYLRRAARGRQRVLEVGCGDGNLIGRLEGVGERWGLDQSEAMLAVARRTTDAAIQYVPGDATMLPFENGSFDLSYTSRCLINVRDPERQGHAIRELARVTRRGGTVILIENFTEGRATLDRLCRRFRLAPLAPIGTQRQLDYERVRSIFAEENCRLIRWHHYRLGSTLYYLVLAQLFRKRGLARAEALFSPVLARIALLDQRLSNGRPIYGKDTTLEYRRE